LPQQIESLEDEIVDIAAGKRHTALLTKSGKLWVTGGYKEEKSSRLNQLKQDLGVAKEESDDSDEKPHKKGKGKKGGDKQKKKPGLILSRQ